MDPFSPIAPACVRVLLLPVGQVERSVFLEVVTNLQQDASVLSLEEFKSTPRDDDFLFSPLHFPRGSVLFNYTVSEVPEHHRQLATFELHRETLLVIGVTAGLSKDPSQVDTQLKKATDELREKHGRVVHRHLLVLDKDVTVSSTNVLHVTTLRSFNEDDLRHAMQQITAHFFNELNTYAKAMQASPGIQTPGQLSQGLLRSMMSREDEARPRSRHSTQAEPRSPSGEENNSRPPSQDLMPPATTFEQMPVANVLGRSDSSASRRSKSRPRTTSFDRVPVLSKERLKDRGKARVGIVTGAIYLIAGQWAEALKVLIDNTTRLRALSDHIWNGKGLELIVVCLLLHLWAGIDVQVPAICYQLSDKVRDRFSKAFAAELAQKISGPQTSAEKLSSSLPDLLRHILLLYHSIEGTMELPYIPVAEATVRFGKILACLHSTNGLLDDQSISDIVERQRPLHKTRWSSATFQSQRPLSKISISDLLLQSLPLSSDSIPLLDYITILTGVASVYTTLRMERKKAMTLKALVARLTAALHQARKIGAAEMGIHPAASLSIDNGTEALADTMRGSTGLSKLAADLVSAYGVGLGSDHFSAVTESFGNKQLKLEILRDLLRMCEASPDLKGISLLVVASMNSAARHESFDPNGERRSIIMPAEEQSRLMAMLGRASWLSKQLGIESVDGQYWDPFLLRGIDCNPVPPERAIYEVHTKSGRITSETSTNPLLYDPNALRLSTKAQAIILPLGETTKFRLTLQNPLDVPLDIERLELITDGVSLKCSIENISLGPARLEHFPVDVLPQAAGDTKIIGCRAKIAGCTEQTYLLTLSPWTNDDESLLKMMGQDILYQSAAVQQPEHDVISAKVVDTQPQLLLREVASHSIMLLEGERQLYTVVLENVSDVPAVVTSIRCHTATIELASNEAGTVVVKPHQSHAQEFYLVGDATMPSARASITYATDATSSYTRVCEVHVDLTIRHAVTIQRLDIRSGDNDTLIVIVDLLNLWLKPCHYTCHADATAIDGVLDSGQSTRIQVQTSRWSTSATDAASIKHELRKHFGVAWRTLGRAGNVSFQNLDLSEEALLVLKGPAILVSLELLNTAMATTQHNEVKMGQFFTVRVVLKNRSNAAAPMLVQLRCQSPAQSSFPERQVAMAGSMSRLVPALGAGQTMSVEFALCPLLSGESTIDASVRPALSPELSLISTSMQSLRLHIGE